MATLLSTTSFGYDNFYRSQLTSDITDSATDIFLDLIPTASEGTLIIDPDSSANREIIFYSSKTGTKVVTPANGRGYDNTTAVPHTAGTAVIMAPIADWFASIQTGQVLDNNSITTAKLNDAAVTPAKLLAGTGSSWAWQSWAPTWTNVTVGNGTVTAAYTQIGKTIVARIRFILGSTSSISGSMIFSLPVTASTLTAQTNYTLGDAYIEDAGAAQYRGAIFFNATTTANLQVFGASGTYVNHVGTSATVPFTWGTNDFFAAQFYYEAA